MSNTTNQTMEKFLLLLDQLYDSSKEIRSLAEQVLNQQLSASLSIQCQFDLLSTLPDHYQLKMVIFLKSWISLHYDQCAEAVQRSISQYFIQRDGYFFQPKIQSHIIQIISYIIQKEYPNSELLHHLIMQSSYTEYTLLILDEVFTQLDNKKHSLVGFYAIVYPKLKMYFFTQESLTPMLHIYLLIIKSRFNDQELLSDITHQWKLISQQEYINLYLKCIWRYLQQQKRQVSLSQFYDILEMLMSYIQQLKENIPIYIRSFQDLQLISSYHFQNSNLIQQIHCKIIKIITAICKRQAHFITSQYTILIIEFCLQYGIQMDIKQFYEFITTQDDFQLSCGLYNLNLRDAAINLITALIDYKDENQICDYLLKQLQAQTNMNQDFRSILRKEALYFVVQKIYTLVQNEIDMNQWYEDSLSIYLNVDNILFLPVKLSILSLISSVQKRHQFFSQNTKLINQLLSILSNQIIHPLQQIAMLQLLSSQNQENLEIQQYLATTIPQIKQVYSTCSNDQNKFELLKLMVNLINLGLELKYFITLIFYEWDNAIKEQHSYKAKTLMLLKILKLTIEQQPFKVYVNVIEFYFQILEQCFQKNYHLLMAHEILHIILKQYLFTEIKLNELASSLTDSFEQHLDSDEDAREQIIWNYMFMTLLDQSDCSKVINFYISFLKLNEPLPSELFDLVALNIFKATSSEIKQLLTHSLTSDNQNPTKISQLLIWMAIYHQNQGDIKQIIFEVEEDLGQKVLIQLLNASVEVCKQSKDYRTTVLSSFFQQFHLQNHLVFDMSYITLNININELINKAYQEFNFSKQELIIDSIKKNYSKAFKAELHITDEIQLKYRFDSLQLDFEKMEIQ